MTGSLKRIGALFYARNLEFVRDRAALVWNLAFPLLLVLGFTLIFSGPPKPLVQMGVVGSCPQPMPRCAPCRCSSSSPMTRRRRAGSRCATISWICCSRPARAVTGSTRTPPGSHGRVPAAPGRAGAAHARP